MQTLTGNETKAETDEALPMTACVARDICRYLAPKLFHPGHPKQIQSIDWVKTELRTCLLLSLERVFWTETWGPPDTTTVQFIKRRTHTHSQGITSQPHRYDHAESQTGPECIVNMCRQVFVGAVWESLPDGRQWWEITNTRGLTYSPQGQNYSPTLLVCVTKRSDQTEHPDVEAISTGIQWSDSWVPRCGIAELVMMADDMSACWLHYQQTVMHLRHNSLLDTNGGNSSL